MAVPLNPAAAESSEGGDIRINILIVDDEPKNLNVLESVLDDPGYRLVRAGSGSQALMALMADEFALLVLDIRMPDMTGLELAQLVKERRKTAQVPIIFLTAYYNQDQQVLEGYGSGAVDYMQKPVNAAILRSKVAVFAELHRKRRALELANRSLLAEVAERRRAEELLLELNKTLDQRVRERSLQLQDADRRKDEFLATLAHELRNPLAPVRNAIQVLRLKGPLTPEVAWVRDVIDRQVQAMTRLIDDLMDVSRISLGKIELRLAPTDLTGVLHDAVEASRPLIDECRHTLVLAPPVEKLMLNADATRLTQLFMNLLNNAAKYMEPGGRMELGVVRNGDEAEITVKDWGIGIAADKLESVFELFSQVETALSRSRGGLGIGLSLSRQFAAMHGGTIRVASAGLGRGSEFVVRLPVLARVAVEESVVTGSQPVPNAALRILVADDNIDAAESLGILLESLGSNPHVVHDGRSAVEAVAGFNPQVAVLDIGMPQLNGYEACRAIRALPGGPELVLIAVTGWGQADDIRRATEAGFDSHMVKPVDPFFLFSKITELVALRHAATS